MQHIKRVDGLSGCYRGLTPKLVGSIVGVIGSKKVAEKFGLNENYQSDSKDESELTEEERYVAFSSFSINCQYCLKSISLRL